METDPRQADPLIQRALHGDAEAFTELVRQYHRQVIGYVRGIVGDPEAADEIAQDVFLAAYQSLNQFAGQSEFSTWLIGIARNKSISALRKTISRRRQEEAIGAHLIAGWKLEYLEKTHEQQRQTQLESLRACLSKLQPEHRQLLERHYRDNQTAESIAKDLGRSGSGVRMLFLRLRQTLHDCMKREST